MPECTSCGACCFSNMEEYVRVFGGDWDRMSDASREYTHFLGNRCYMRMEGGHCAALRIDPGAGLFLCAIYPERSDCCSGLARGSGACLGELATKADRPRDKLATLRRAASPTG